MTEVNMGLFRATITINKCGEYRYPRRPCTGSNAQFKSDRRGGVPGTSAGDILLKHCTLLFLRCMRSDNFSSPAAKIVIGAARATFDNVMIGLTGGGSER